MIDDDKCAEICKSVGRYLDAKLSCNHEAAEVLLSLVAALLHDAPIAVREEWVTILCEYLELSLTPHQGAVH
jgi:hypothetical protein